MYSFFKMWNYDILLGLFTWSGEYQNKSLNASYRWPTVHYILLVRIPYMNHWVICFEDYRLCAMTYMYFYYREDFALFITPIVFIGLLSDIFLCDIIYLGNRKQKRHFVLSWLPRDPTKYIDRELWEPNINIIDKGA